MSEAALLPETPDRHWVHTGLTLKQERVFSWIASVLVALMMSAWTVSIIDAYHDGKGEGRGKETLPPEPGSRAGAVSKSLTSALTDPRSTSTAYINDAALEFLEPVRGESGKLRAVFRTPGEGVGSPDDRRMAARFEGKGASVSSPGWTAPQSPGIYSIAVSLERVTREINDLSLITLVPFSSKKKGKIGFYYLGSWPYEQGTAKPRSAAYANPEGFIEVTRENKDTFVSEHFRLSDFLTKDQLDVWPKYLLLQPKMLDKLELIILELQKSGYQVKHVTVMSGFRTPRYNHGGGNTGGRANLSRHMYGDGADVFVDNDRNGWTDDLNRDGKVDIRDTEIVSAAAERVERDHPALIGGIGTYTACCGHGPFTHVDVRGYRARWRGSGNG